MLSLLPKSFATCRKERGVDANSFFCVVEYGWCLSPWLGDAVSSAVPCLLCEADSCYHLPCRRAEGLPRHMARSALQRRQTVLRARCPYCCQRCLPMLYRVSQA